MLKPIQEMSMSDAKPAHKRILLKLSGEALMGDDQFGINRATIVRMVLVPATMELLGERNWWWPRPFAVRRRAEVAS